MTTTSHIETNPDSIDSPPGEDERRRSEGRRVEQRAGQLFGGLMLSAFLLYGVGSALVDEPLGLVLIAANSIAVTVIGVVGFRLLRDHHRRAGLTYLAARAAEALLLAGGVALYSFNDVTDADTTGYLLGMIALGVGSLPFWYVVGRGPWLGKRFAIWGMVGYVALASGALLELATGEVVSVVAAIPGGLFELAVAIHLLRRGFGSPDAPR